LKFEDDVEDGGGRGVEVDGIVEVGFEGVFGVVGVVELAGVAGVVGVVGGVFVLLLGF